MIKEQIRPLLLVASIAGSFLGGFASFEIRPRKNLTFGTPDHHSPRILANSRSNILSIDLSSALIHTPDTMPPRPQRASTHKVSKLISNIAAGDLDSDDDLDVTLVRSGGSEEEEDNEEDEKGKLEQDDDDPDQRSTKDSDDDNDNDEDSDSSINIPQKRKRGAGKKSKPADSFQLLNPAAEDTPKSKNSRGPPIATDIIALKSDEPFDRLKAQLGVKIGAALNPQQLNYDDYNLTFTVPRQVSDAMQLTDEVKYKYLVDNALKIKSNPGAKIFVEVKTGVTAQNKENENGEDDDEGPAKKKRKTKVPKERDILPANAAVNAKIAVLRERHLCPTPNGPCGSEHCFLKGDQFATIDKPPNNQLFDRINPRSLAAQSPLLQRRLDLKQSANNSQININIPPELLALLPRPAPPVPAVPPANGPIMLIPSHLITGPTLLMGTFCTQYDLDDDLSERFRHYKFKTTDSLSYVSISQLMTMEFAPGEIAELQVVVAKWAVRPGA
ncbi:hypothetical protein C8R46DRAFT_1034776 [Mycena filopes]|nr:hypothetical protein C8R46DRAFT_1034776 [Mycena filopes]